MEGFTEMSDDSRHHTNYVSEQQVVFKCTLTYLDIFSNMPLQWYVQNVYDSVNRKGYSLPYEDIQQWVGYFLKDEIKYCEHCYGTGKR